MTAAVLVAVLMSVAVLVATGLDRPSSAGIRLTQPARAERIIQSEPAPAPAPEPMPGPAR